MSEQKPKYIDMVITMFKTGDRNIPDEFKNFSLADINSIFMDALFELMEDSIVTLQNINDYSNLAKHIKKTLFWPTDAAAPT
jgi:hypothetical protein